ncbi:hypothetical protein HOP50_05g37170 [Chloropicon primus]|nr:hypothetical protein HOP50_05g37170 [Chloropicon primus]
MRWRTFLEAVTKATSPEEKKKARLRTDLSQEKLFDQMPSFTLGWYQRMFQSFKRKKSRRFERKKGARFNFVPLYGHSNYLYLSDYTYDVELMYLAAFQGSKKVMKWLGNHSQYWKHKGKFSFPLKERNTDRTRIVPKATDKVDLQRGTLVRCSSPNEIQRRHRVKYYRPNKYWLSTEQGQ